MTIKEKILSSIEPVIKNSKYVSIEKKQIRNFAKKLLSITSPPWNNTLQFLGNEEQTIHYYFFVDNLNFCSWPEKGKEKWFYNNNGEWISGYYGKSMAIKHAFETNKNMFSSKYLSTIPYESFADIFKGKGTMQLLKERHNIIQETFSIIQKEFDGRVINIFHKSHFDANQIVELLITYFPRFKDISTYENHPVYFLKLAQITPGDVNNALKGSNQAYVKNIQDLTIFADTLIPQLLQAEGVLHYTEKLLDIIKKEELIPSGSLEEIEIRAHAIYACELVREELEKLDRKMTSNELDWILWVTAKSTEFPLPYHKTLSIYY